MDDGGAVGWYFQQCLNIIHSKNQIQCAAGVFLSTVRNSLRTKKFFLINCLISRDIMKWKGYGKLCDAINGAFGNFHFFLPAIQSTSLLACLSVFTRNCFQLEIIALDNCSFGSNLLVGWSVFLYPFHFLQLWQLVTLLTQKYRLIM